MTTPQGATILGEYVLLDRIGVGGMADVFRAERRSVGGFVRRVAVKRILPHLASNEEFVRMFIDEARIAASLHHANIVAIHDLGQIDGQLCLIMELVEGKPLSEVLTKLAAQNLPLYLRHALLIALDACKGLHAAHERRVNGMLAPVVHRDVSPHNILISFAGEVKISDFGVAKAAEQVSVTEANTVKGKISYMAPEVATGQGMDTRADIFAVGIIMHEMLTGRRLFAGGPYGETLNRVLQMPIPTPSSVRSKLPPEIDRIVGKALMRDPTKRYQRIADLARDISHLLVTARLEATNAELGDFMRELFPAEAQAEQARNAGDKKTPDTGSLQRIWDQINTVDPPRPAAPEAALRPAPRTTPAPGGGRDAQEATSRRTQFVSVVKELASVVHERADMSLWLQVALLAKLALGSHPPGKRQMILDGLVKAAAGNFTLPQRGRQ
ncbi:MAG: serine/threonine protein kinase [Deltaproteobacteria bacterium]|nr:serine/threonine protein kinase [Deltaproteobacteria bacterium]